MLSKFTTSIIFLLFAIGCQNIQTQHNSNELLTTVPQLFYQQVLDNLALTIAKPGSLPYFCLPTQGTDTNTRSLQASYAPGWDFVPAVGHYLFDKQGSTIQGQFQNAESFQLSPVTDPDKLVLLQTALRFAAGDPTISPSDMEIFTGFYTHRNQTLPIFYTYYHAVTGGCLPVPLLKVDPTDQAEKKPPKPDINQINPPPCDQFEEYRVGVPARWFRYTRRKNKVPQNACYVANCCDVWVWTCPNMIKDFTDFTLAMIDIASFGNTNNIAKNPFASAEQEKKAEKAKLESENNKAQQALKKLQQEVDDAKKMLNRSNLTPDEENTINKDIEQKKKKYNAEKIQVDGKVNANNELILKLNDQIETDESLRRSFDAASPQQPLISPRATPPFPFPAPPQ